MRLKMITAMYVDNVLGTHIFILLFRDKNLRILRFNFLCNSIKYDFSYKKKKNQI